MESQKVAATLNRVSSRDKISDAKESKNHLLFVRDFGGAPTVSAGDDVIKRLPVSSVTLHGHAKDLDGYITSASWSQVSGPAVQIESSNVTWNLKLTLKNIPVGDYVFKLTATDNDDLSSSDDVRVKIISENLAPIANAGKDQIQLLGKPIQVDGTASKDDDGKIVRYEWSQQSGPNEAMIVNAKSAKTEIRQLRAGLHQFRLQVYDNDGASTDDSVFVRVNTPPSAEVEDDRTIFLPQNSVELTGLGKDADGHKVRFLWRQISGPRTVEINDPNQARIKISNLIEGSYVFRFHVFDQFNAIATDSIKIIVKPDQNKPIVNAGDDVDVRLPQKVLTLRGSCRDRRGHCVKTSWRMVDQQLNFGSLKQVLNELQLSNLQPGSYRFVFKGENDRGFTNQDEVKVRIRSALRGDLKSYER